MKNVRRSRQHHDLYAQYHDQDNEIRELLGKCGVGAKNACRVGRIEQSCYLTAGRLGTAGTNTYVTETKAAIYGSICDFIWIYPGHL